MIKTHFVIAAQNVDVLKTLQAWSVGSFHAIHINQKSEITLGKDCAMQSAKRVYAEVHAFGLVMLFTVSIFVRFHFS